MTIHGMHREASIEIQASPEAIYDLLEPRGTGTRLTEIWDVAKLSLGRQHATLAQLDERSRYTEAMLATTLAASIATAEG